jgi:hypothetical protein
MPEPGFKRETGSGWTAIKGLFPFWRARMKTVRKEIILVNETMDIVIEKPVREHMKKRGKREITLSLRMAGGG